MLKERGILGMNRRNGEYILGYNPRAYYPLVDNKLESKKLAVNAGIMTPELYAVIEMEHQVANLSTLLAQHEKFVIKPAHGSGGDGIVVIDGRRRNNYLKADGTIITHEDLCFHVSNILSGMYSLGGHSDSAIVEYRVEFDPLFENVSYLGVPDIRMIVFCGYPIMAMVRLPTRQSGGKANLHQGAVGVGVDLHTGTTLFGVLQNHTIDHHPDTGASIDGLVIPGWRHLLRFCASCYELTHLGYLGVDIVLDRSKGPLMLELNARPGLAIQIANQSGLLPRLQAVQETLKDHPHRSAQARVDYVLSEAVFKH